MLVSLTTQDGKDLHHCSVSYTFLFLLSEPQAMLYFQDNFLKGLIAHQFYYPKVGCDLSITNLF